MHGLFIEDFPLVWNVGTKLFMRILYISDRANGGILRHVKCLRECLPHKVITYQVGHGGDEEFAGRNGHDLREFCQIRRVIKKFKPDVVHFHIPVLLMVLYIRFFTKIPIVRSWHTPTSGKEGLKRKFMRWLFGKKCYYLPVSKQTWAGLRKWESSLKGEVFFNPLNLAHYHLEVFKEGCKGKRPVVGMVGRNAEQKDWPSFHRVEFDVKTEMPDVEFVNGGECEPCNGLSEIKRMDVFVMTSKHEELPTTLLECFALGTAVCGFIPVGGVSDILAFSSGPLKEVFIKERDTARLAKIVSSLLRDEAKRKAVMEDGWQILINHFDAHKNCHGQLLEIYGRLIK